MYQNIYKSKFIKTIEDLKSSYITRAVKVMFASTFQNLFNVSIYKCIYYITWDTF